MSVLSPGSYSATTAVSARSALLNPRGVNGYEPTNNDAERVLRHAVLWRKSSGGTDSEAGSRFVERMLSVVATCRQQNRNVLEFLTACCRARLDGSEAPSLLPAKAEPAAA